MHLILSLSRPGRRAAVPQPLLIDACGGSPINEGAASQSLISGRSLEGRGSTAEGERERATEVKRKREGAHS